MTPYLLVFGSSFVASLLLVPLVRRLSFRLGKVVAPRDNRWNKKPTPTMGGIGMFLSFSVGMLVITLIDREDFHLSGSILAGASLMFLLGLVDDLKQLSPPTKLLGQILAASILIFFGHVINFFPWPLANILLTFFWLVGITNAINLLDNMDGLAGGIAIIAAGFLAYFFTRNFNPGLLVISLALIGGILGFLVFNFPPAKIFMGDSGSQFLGYTLAALAVVHRPRASDVFTVLGVPTLLFLLPIIDTSLVTITRLLRGQSPAQGGTDHTSHRLIAFGLNERQAVLTLYAIGLLSGLSGAVLEALDYDLSLLFIPILVISLSLVVAYLGRLKVVSSTAPASRSLTRIMVDLTYRRRILEILLDFFLIGVCFYLAFWTSYNLRIDNSGLTLYARALPVVMAGSFISFLLLGVYRGVWRYAGVDELLRYALAVLAAASIAYLGLLVFFRSSSFPPEMSFLYAIFLYLGLAASRLSFSVLDRMYSRRQGASEKQCVLIYGAEDAGEITLRWILRNPELGYQAVGFLDENQLIWGRRIHGLNVLGGIDKLEAVLAEKQAAGVIIATSGSLANENSDQIMTTCRQKGVWVRVLRLDFELME